MDTSTAIQQGLIEVRTHWFRSLLTMIGIVMGVGSMMSMLALTEGAAEGLRQFSRETGGYTKTVLEADSPPADQAAKAGQSNGLTVGDLEALRATGAFAWVAPVQTFPGEKIEYGVKSTSQAILYASELEMLEMDRLRIKFGRWLSPLDLERKQAVCVIGYRVAEALFDDPEHDAIGASVTIRGMNFRVVGVGDLVESEFDKRSKESGRSQMQAARRTRRGNSWNWDPFWWKNRFVAIPLTTAQSSAAFAAPGRVPGYLLQIQIGFRTPEERATAQDLAKRTVLARHNGIQDFKFNDDLKDLTELETQIHRQRITGSVIAAISLFVGGLGIINIMLASVADRIRELGVRLAVGAKGRDLFLQVLGESVLLAGFAGVFGLGAGYLLLRGLEALSPEQNVPVIQPLAIVISLGSAVGTGFLAGLFPAWKAMRVTVIDALKSE